MEPMASTLANPLDLERIVARQIDARTGGRIRYLRVEVHESCLLITGYAPSYYLKQLALAAVQDVLQSSLSVHILVEIEVGHDGHCIQQAHTRPGQHGSSQAHRVGVQPGRAEDNLNQSSVRRSCSQGPLG